MKLSSLLVVDHTVPDLEARTLAEAVPEILRRVEHFNPGEPVDALVRAVLRREAQGSTAMQNGIAIPHARVPALRDFYVFLGVAKTPLEEKGFDGLAIDLVFLILASDQKNTVMLQTMAAIGSLAKDSDCLAKIRHADSAKAIWQPLDEGDFQVKKGLFAHDLMHAPPVVAREDMALGELLDAFFQHQVYAAPVCSPDGQVVGSVSTGEIVDAAFPEYMSRMRDIAFLAEFEPFEEFFKKEATIRVGEIMNPHPLVVDTDEPMIQVVFRMKSEQRGIAFVQEKGRLVGVIGRNDIVSRILRA